MSYYRDIQVLVIGGGPAGSTAARLLGREGIETVLIEKDLSFSKPCGGGIPSPVFKELSLPENAIKRLVHKMRIVSPSGVVLDIPLKGGSIAIVERVEFDSSLRMEAKKDGVEVIRGEFLSFGEIGRRIVSDVLVDNGMKKIRAEYIVAADGVNSRVRHCLGLGLPASFLTVTQKAEGETEFCEFWLSAEHAPHLYSWVFPSSKGLSIGTGVIGSINAKTALSRFIMRRGVNGNLSACNDCLRATTHRQAQAGQGVRGFRIPLWKGDIFNKGKVLFAGDAAGQVMPLSFEGIYYAMKSGQLAAEAIINRRVSDYKRLWKKAFHKRFLLMRLLWEYFLKSDERAERLVELLKRPELQEASMKLWLSKDMSQKSLLSYLRHFT